MTDVDGEGKQCPNCNGLGRISELVENDREIGRDREYAGGECDRCNGSGEI